MDGFQVVIDVAAALGCDPQFVALGNQVLSEGRLGETVADRDPGTLVLCEFGTSPVLRAADVQRPGAGGLAARRVLADAAEEVLECVGPVPHAWTGSGGEDCTACGRLFSSGSWSCVRTGSTGPWTGLWVWAAAR